VNEPPRRVDHPEGWTDGDGCDWYAGDPDRCSDHGHVRPEGNDGGLTANEACAVCGGGALVADIDDDDRWRRNR